VELSATADTGSAREAGSAGWGGKGAPTEEIKGRARAPRGSPVEEQGKEELSIAAGTRRRAGRERRRGGWSTGGGENEEGPHTPQGRRRRKVGGWVDQGALGLGEWVAVSDPPPRWMR
jgi:hypothetical protein